MKITQIMLSKGWGGAERLFVELCASLAAMGHQVQVICHPRFARGEHLRQCPGITYATVPALGNWDLYSLWRIKTLVDVFAPDILHAHLTRASWMSGRVGRQLDIPTVATAHNWIGRKYIKNIDYFTAITDELHGHLRSCGIATERIRKIPNFSQLPAVAQAPPLERRPPVFVALGRFVKKKGFIQLLEAHARFVREVGPARLLLGGSGEEEAALRAFVVSHDLAPWVEFCGWVEDVAGFLSRGDIFVLPSLDEPFGIVLLEAMALGKPIIATRTSGPKDLLDDTAGFFAEPGDVDGLLRAMRAAAEAPEASRRKAEQALALYRDRYRQEMVVPLFSNYFREICRDPGTLS